MCGFLKKILALVIINRIGKEKIDPLRKAGKFKHVLVQDSTIIGLPVRSDAIATLAYQYTRVYGLPIGRTPVTHAFRFTDRLLQMLLRPL